MQPVKFHLLKRGDKSALPILSKAQEAVVVMVKEITVIESPSNKPQVLIMGEEEGTVLVMEAPVNAFQCLSVMAGKANVCDALVLYPDQNGVYTVKGKPVSDGYHTFDELYDHRVRLYLCLSKALTKLSAVYCWKSKRHSDNTQYPGWFILGLGTNVGEQIPYLVPIQYWDEANWAREMVKAPEFDQHTSKDVLFRLEKLTRII